MTSTALIIRPPENPPVHVLECDGPRGFAEVHRFPGDHSGDYLTFEAFCALPDYAKMPPRSVWEIEHATVRRIYRLLENAERGGTIHPAHLLEIRGRLKVLHPFCDEDF